MLDIEGKAVALMTDVQALSKMYSLGIRDVHFDRLEAKDAFEFSVGYWRDSGFKQAPTKEILEDKVDGIVVGEATESPVFIANELKKRYAAKLATIAITDVAQEMRSDPQSAVRTLSDNLWVIRKNNKNRKNSSDLVSDISERRKRYQERAFKSDSGILGESLGFDDIDNISSGIRPGELVTMVAAPKVGKTWMLLQIAKRCIEQGHSCLVFTLEMDVHQMEDRFEALLSGVSYDRLDKGRLDTAEWNKLIAVQEKEKDLGHIRFVKPQFGERTVENMMRIARDEQCDLMLIDQLSFIESSRGNGRSEQIANIILELKSAISEDEDFMIPTLLLHQFNRGGASAGENADINSIAGSSEVERSSDALISLSQTKEQRRNDALIFQVLASRRYDTAKFLLSRHLKDKTEFTCVKRIDDEDDVVD